eukprot:3467531-Amphidinium_carterae.1
MEHVMHKMSSGVSRVVHMLRVHGRALAQHGSFRKFDSALSSVLDGFFSGLTDDSHDVAARPTQLEEKEESAKPG